MIYEPSGAALATLAGPGTVAVVEAVHVDELLFSADGRRWERRPAQEGQPHALEAGLTDLGFYVVASGPEPGSSGAGGGRAVLYALVVGLPPAALAGLALARRRRR